MLFGRKNKPNKLNKIRVNLGDLHDEKEHLTRFLQSAMKVDITPSGNELIVTSEELSPETLEQKVRKFVYHRNLNNTYWVSLKGDVVKFNKFKADKKQKKSKKEGTTPAIITHGW